MIYYNNYSESGKIYYSGMGELLRLRASMHGFTLIELLIVISVIAILAGMLFPSLNKARLKARSVSCLNQMKQIGTADSLYQNDYGYFCPGAEAMAPGVQGAPNPMSIWSGKRLKESTYVNDYTKEGFLTPYLKKAKEGVSFGNEASNNVFFCPDQVVLALLAANGATASAAPGSGIGINLKIHGWFSGTSYPMCKPGKIKTSVMVSFADQMGGMNKLDESSNLWGYSVNQQSTAFRHGGRANVAWADGHASSEAPGYIGSGGLYVHYNVGGLGENSDDERFYNPESSYSQD